MSQQLLDVLKEQRRQRRLRFWLGFVAILLVGGLWAQLSKDPIGPAFGNGFVGEAEEDIFFEDAPAEEFFDTTTIAPEPIDDEEPAVTLTTAPEPTTDEAEITTTVTEP